MPSSISAFFFAHDLRPGGAGCVFRRCVSVIVLWGCPLGGWESRRYRDLLISASLIVLSFQCESQPAIENVQRFGPTQQAYGQPSTATNDLRRKTNELFDEAFELHPNNSPSILFVLLPPTPIDRNAKTDPGLQIPAQRGHDHERPV